MTNKIIIGNQSELRAFNDDPELKERIVNQVLQYQKADKIIQDEHWENNKGSAIGYIIHFDIRKKFEELGIPKWFALLIDHIFDNLENKDDTKLLPYRIINAIPTGFFDWQNLYHDFCYCLLDEICVCDESVKEEVNTIKNLHKKRETDEKIWKSALLAAKSAAHLISYSPSKSASQLAVCSATQSIPYSEVTSAYSAADLAACSASNLGSSSVIDTPQVFKKIADKLIQLLNNQK